MDQSERERLARWLKEKWRHGPCPVCQSNDWKSSARLGRIVSLDGEHRVPVLFITCQVCGYLATVNALLAGVRPHEAARDDTDLPSWRLPPGDEIEGG
jgi:hypothetical protein